MKEGPDLHSFGLSIIPCHYGTGSAKDKTPRIDSWKRFQTTRPTSQEVETWRTTWPMSNWAVVTGEVSGLFVLDIDSTEGETYCTERGVPETVEVKTAKGRHLWFRWPGFPVGNRARFVPGCDIRGNGGYVLAPGSLHPDGIAYTWADGRSIEDCPIADAPEWLLAAVRGDAPKVRPTTSRYDQYVEKAIREETDAVKIAPVGTRNDTLNRAAFALGTLAGANMIPEQDVRAHLLNAARLNGFDGSFTESEVLATINSGVRDGMQHPRVLPAMPYTNGVTHVDPVPVEDEPDPPSLIFRPVWTNEPPNIPPIVTFNGIRFASPGNLSAIIAQPGTGKSAVCEAICAARIDPDADTLSFEVRTEGGVVYVDTERSTADHWQSWARTMRRASVTPEDGEPRDVDFMLFRSIPTVQQRRAELEAVVGGGAVKLLLLDGVADFVKDVNDSEESADLILWLMAISNRFDMSVVVTIHSNPQLASDKARGHLGSDIQRRAEGLVQVTRDHASGARCITTKFQHGKVRNDNDQMEVYFSWDTDARMFRTTGKPEGAAGISLKRQDELSGMARLLTNEGTRPFTYTDLIRAIAAHTGTKDKNAQKVFQGMRSLGFMVQGPDRMWRYDPTSDPDQPF